MDLRARFSRCATLCLLTASFGLLSATAGCGGADDAGISNRLWIDHIPTDKRDQLTALLVGPPGAEGKTFGVFYRGTVFRGTFDAVEWIADPEDVERATIRLIQDERRAELTIERCDPDPKFDACVLLRGEPHGVERFQSRRRWGARGAGSASSKVEAIFSEILAEDPELSATFALSSNDASGLGDE